MGYVCSFVSDIRGFETCFPWLPNVLATLVVIVGLQHVVFLGGGQASCKIIRVVTTRLWQSMFEADLPLSTDETDLPSFCRILVLKSHNFCQRFLYKITDV